MPKFKIVYGVGGGYNDINEDVIEAVCADAASEEAYLLAEEVFNSYGIYEKELEGDEEGDEESYNECLESWVTYYAEPVNE